MHFSLLYTCVKLAFIADPAEVDEVVGIVVLPQLQSVELVGKELPVLAIGQDGLCGEWIGQVHQRVETCRQIINVR